jgi:predicted RNase H-like HicB family nuclease
MGEKLYRPGLPAHTYRYMATIKQRILTYPAIFHSSGKDMIEVSFPDFPGCVTFGRNLEEARNKAQEVLELWLAELQSNGEEIPMHATQPIIDQVTVTIPH